MTLKHLLDLFRSHFPEKIAWKLGTEEQHRSCGLVRFHSNLSVVIGQCNSWWHSCRQSRLLILLSSVHQRCSYFLCLVPLIKTINRQMPFMCTMTLPSSNKKDWYVTVWQYLSQRTLGDHQIINPSFPMKGSVSTLVPYSNPCSWNFKI